MSYPSPYHQSTNLSWPELRERIISARYQDQMVLTVFECGFARSPSQIHTMLTALGKKLPITSVRRSISNLTKAGALVKTPEQRRGPLGHVETLWVKP